MAVSAKARILTVVTIMKRVDGFRTCLEMELFALLINWNRGRFKNLTVGIEFKHVDPDLICV